MFPIIRHDNACDNQVHYLHLISYDATDKKDAFTNEINLFSKRQ